MPSSFLPSPLPTCSILPKALKGKSKKELRDDLQRCVRITLCFVIAVFVTPSSFPGSPLHYTERLPNSNDSTLYQTEGWRAWLPSPEVVGLLCCSAHKSSSQVPYRPCRALSQTLQAPYKSPKLSPCCQGHQTYHFFPLFWLLGSCPS